MQFSTLILYLVFFFFFFFFNDTATTEIYTLSLHDALPILDSAIGRRKQEECVDHRLAERREDAGCVQHDVGVLDRKSTRLNSSHDQISYAVFCLKKKKKTPTRQSLQCHSPIYPF